MDNDNYTSKIAKKKSGTNRYLKWIKTEKGIPFKDNKEKIKMDKMPEVS